MFSGVMRLGSHEYLQHLVLDNKVGVFGPEPLRVDYHRVNDTMSAIQKREDESVAHLQAYIDHVWYG